MHTVTPLPFFGQRWSTCRHPILWTSCPIMIIFGLMLSQSLYVDFYDVRWLSLRPITVTESRVYGLDSQPMFDTQAFPLETIIPPVLTRCRYIQPSIQTQVWFQSCERHFSTSLAQSPKGHILWEIERSATHRFNTRHARFCRVMFTPVTYTGDVSRSKTATYNGTRLLE